MQTSPGSWTHAGSSSEAIAQVCLIYKSALQRDVAQRRVSLQHVLSGQLQATPNHEGVRWYAECAFEGACEVRFAQPNMRAEICGEYRTCDVAIDILTHLAHPPDW